MKRLADRVAVVTGAGSGIGRATSEALARAGCHVALVDVSETAAQEAAEAIRSLGRPSRELAFLLLGLVLGAVLMPALIWLEELVEVAERSASAPVYSLLKREDERYVTMQAYDNPVFVEDMARAAAVALRADARVASYRISAENDESIHDHKAFARTSWRRP